MRTSSFLLIAIVIFVCSAEAQSPIMDKDDLREQLQYGYKVGTNYAGIVDFKGESFSAKPVFGILSGIFAAIPISKFFGIQPEALFSQKGFRGEGYTSGYYFELKRTASYLDLPVYFLYKPYKFLSVMIGPEFSLLIQQDDKFRAITDVRLLKDQFYNDKIRKSNFSLTGGLDFYLNRIELGAKAGIDLQNNNGSANSTPMYYRNIWCQATIGYRVHL